MPRINLQGLTRSASTDTNSLYAQLRNQQSDLESQINEHPNVVARTDLKVPRGTKSRDVFVSLVKGVLRLGFYDGKRVRYLNNSDLQSLQSHGTNFKGLQTGPNGPANALTRTTYFPNHGDWGFFIGPGPTFNLFFNNNNTNQFVAM